MMASGHARFREWNALNIGSVQMTCFGIWLIKYTRITVPLLGEPEQSTTTLMLHYVGHSSQA
jgi:hypothetical protein